MRGRRGSQRNVERTHRTWLSHLSPHETPPRGVWDSVPVVESCVVGLPVAGALIVSSRDDAFQQVFEVQPAVVVLTAAVLVGLLEEGVATVVGPLEVTSSQASGTLVSQWMVPSALAPFSCSQMSSGSVVSETPDWAARTESAWRSATVTGRRRRASDGGFRVRRRASPVSKDVFVDHNHDLGAAGNAPT